MTDDSLKNGRFLMWSLLFLYVTVLYFSQPIGIIVFGFNNRKIGLIVWWARIFFVPLRTKCERLLTFSHLKV